MKICYPVAALHFEVPKIFLFSVVKRKWVQKKLVVLNVAAEMTTFTMYA